MSSGNGIWGTNQNNPYPQTEFLDPSTNRPSRAWQQFFLNLLNYTSSSSATSGTGSLPAKPAGFMNVTVNGKAYKVPYYNQ
jgi:hypothetical protein